MTACKRGHPPDRDADGHCSECRRQRRRAHYAENLGTERSRKKKYADVSARRQRESRAVEPDRHRNYGRKYTESNPARILLRHAKTRAKKGGYACTIAETDIVIPTRCPLLGIELKRGSGIGGTIAGSPSLDKIKPELGYVPGNVWVVSHRANSIKRDASLEELERLVCALRKVQHGIGAR